MDNNPSKPEEITMQALFLDKFIEINTTLYLHEKQQNICIYLKYNYEQSAYKNVSNIHFKYIFL